MLTADAGAISRRGNVDQPAESAAEMLSAAQSAHCGDTVQFFRRFGQKSLGVFHPLADEFFANPRLGLEQVYSHLGASIVSTWFNSSAPFRQVCWHRSEACG